MPLRAYITDKLVAFLTRPVSRYERRYWNDPEALKRHARKGDILLVEGDQRVSEIIKYLTQSSWSHAVLYVGDELVQRGGELGERVRATFGDDADMLVVEALMEGVVASPITKYIDYNIRLVRPHRLQPDDLKGILDGALAAIGWRYDLRNIIDLMLDLLPSILMPFRRLRHGTATLGSAEPTQVICSSLIGRLFHRVGFPVLPAVTFPDAPGESSEHVWPTWRLRRLLGVGPRESHGVFRTRHPSLLTPRDFDLSPYFEVIKFNAIADGFDYRQIHWAEDVAVPEVEEREDEQA